MTILACDALYACNDLSKRAGQAAVTAASRTIVITARGYELRRTLADRESASCAVLSHRRWPAYHGRALAGASGASLTQKKLGSCFGSIYGSIASVECMSPASGRATRLGEQLPRISFTMLHVSPARACSNSQDPSRELGKFYEDIALTASLVFGTTSGQKCSARAQPVLSPAVLSSYWRHS